MVLAFDRCASLSASVVLLAISALVRSQAPGDAFSESFVSCEKKDVPDGVVRLLDSQWYPTLSSGDYSAGWTQTPENSVSSRVAIVFAGLSTQLYMHSDYFVLTANPNLTFDPCTCKHTWQIYTALMRKYRKRSRTFTRKWAHPPVSRW